MRTSNPALKESTFKKLESQNTKDVMTLEGAVNRCIALVALVFLGAIWTWNQSYPEGWEIGREPKLPVWYWGLVLGNLVLGFVIIFKKHLAPRLSPIYALLEGATLGIISAAFEFRFPGIVFQAILLTFGTLAALLVAYKTKLIKPTENFKLGVISATFGICIVYVVSMVMGLFGIQIPLLHSGGSIGIGLSVFVVVIAALNLVLDFDFIEEGAKVGAPKYMEWYAAFGLLVTLVWLYLEVLRMLALSRKK